MLRKLLPVLFVLIMGCQSTLTPTFVQSIREHRQDTVLVNQSLISALQEEMEAESRPEVKEAYQEIINNLSTISHQAEILEKYVWNKMTEEELIEVLRAKWRTE